VHKKDGYQVSSWQSRRTRSIRSFKGIETGVSGSGGAGVARRNSARRAFSRCQCAELALAVDSLLMELFGPEGVF
jgi:hypothetical protein